MPPLLALLAVFEVPLAQPAVAQTDDRDVVLALVQTFFDAMAEKDTTTLNQLLLDGGQFVSIREEENAPVLRVSPYRDWLAELPARRTRVLERIREPTVLVEGRIAVVWSRYDFHIDGRFSHCGTDAFNFLKRSDGWVLTGITWTVERGAACERRPLGARRRTMAHESA